MSQTIIPYLEITGLVPLGVNLVSAKGEVKPQSFAIHPHNMPIASDCQDCWGDTMTLKDLGVIVAVAT